MDYLKIPMIHEFWKWFESHGEEFEVNSPTFDAVGALEERLHVFGDFDWEIGPSMTKKSFLAISPRGQRRLLKLSRQIVKFSPSLDDWEFLAAKPARRWNLLFEIVTDQGEVTVNAKRWEFVVYRFPDGVYDLLLKPENEIGLSKEQIYMAAIIIADGELGEEKRIEKISTIEVVDKWNAREQTKAVKLEIGLLSKAVT